MVSHVRERESGGSVKGQKKGREREEKTVKLKKKTSSHCTNELR